MRKLRTVKVTVNAVWETEDQDIIIEELGSYREAQQTVDDHTLAMGMEQWLRKVLKKGPTEEDKEDFPV